MCDSATKSLVDVAKDSNKLGLVFWENKQYHEAVKCFSDAIEFDSNNVSFYCNRIMVWIELYQYKEALDDAMMCLDLDKKSTIGYEMIIKCHIAFGNLYEANNCLHTIFSAHGCIPYFVAMNKLIQELFFIVGDYQRFILAGKHFLALYAINQLLKHITHNVEFKIVKAQILIQIHMYVEAEITAKEVLAVFPDNPGALAIVKYTQYCAETVKANDGSQMKEFSNFRSFMIMQNNPNKTNDAASAQSSPPPKEWKVGKEQRLEKSKNMEMEKRRAKEAQIQKIKDEANKAMQAAYYQRSYELYLHALTIDPSNAQESAKLHFNKSVAASKLGKTQLAIGSCTEAIKLDPEYLKAYLRRAKLYMDSMRLDEAIHDYAKVVRLKPEEEYMSLLENALKLKDLEEKSKNASENVSDEPPLNSTASIL